MSKKIEELFRYLICGIATTVVSLLSYFLLTKFVFDPKVPLELQFSNIISWIIAVIFSFTISRRWVFTSTGNLIPEFFRFSAARILTLLCDMTLMYCGVSLLNLDDKLMKLVVQVVITILNYAFSKLFVFKEVKNRGKNSCTHTML